MAKSLTLMIVDDDVDDRELFIEASRSLKSSIQCLTAANGEDALRILREENAFLPDFIFIDLNMPRFSGTQLLAEIKSDKKLSRIPAIIYTTSRSAEQKEECKKLGAADYITKPSDFEDIRKAIWRVVNKQAHH